MRTFCTPKGDIFESLIKPYRKYMADYILLMEKVSQEDDFIGSYRTFNDYIKICQWPIRKLEYGYIIEKILPYVFSGVKLLDAGCGVTPLPFLMGKLGCRVTAIDFSEEDMFLMNRIKNKNIFPGYQNVEFKVDNILKLESEDNSYDIVTCASVLEHIDYPQYMQALGELYRVLKPGGVLICTIDFWNRQQRRNCTSEGAFNAKDIEYIISNFKEELDDESKELSNLNITDSDIEKFWLSHVSPEIGYSGNRGYAAVGFTIIKKEIELVGAFNTVLTKDLLSKYLEVYSSDQVLIDLLLLDFWARENNLDIISSGRSNDTVFLYERLYRLWEYRQLIKALEIDKKSDTKLLDFGGVSCHATYYAALKGLKVTSLDINPEIIEIKQQTADYMGLKNINTLLADMRDLSCFDDNTFDLVMSASVFEHLSIDDQINSMKEVYRVLKTGGRAAISFDYGIPAPGANIDLPPPHEPPISSLDVIERYCIESGLKIVGNQFSSITYPFWDSVYYSPAILLLEKYDTNKQDDKVNYTENTFTPWKPENSSVYPRYCSIEILTKTIFRIIKENYTKINLINQIDKDRKKKVNVINSLENRLRHFCKHTENDELDQEARLNLIKMLDAMLKEKDIYIEKIENDREARLNLIEKLDAMLKEKDMHIEEIENDREARLKLIVKLDKELKMKNNEMEKIQKELSEKSSLIKELTEKSNITDQEKRQLSNELNSIKNSWFYKVGKMLKFY